MLFIEEYGLSLWITFECFALKVLLKSSSSSLYDLRSNLRVKCMIPRSQGFSENRLGLHGIVDLSASSFHLNKRIIRNEEVNVKFCTRFSHMTKTK